LLSVDGITRVYGDRIGCADVSFDLWPGEVLAIVGESGSGKTTLLNCISSRLTPTCGTVHYRMRDGASADIYKMAEAERRYLMRTDWGFVHQNPIDGLRMTVSAGANVGERLMAVGNRHYGNIRGAAIEWLGRVEIAADRVDDQPRAFSGGMRQRLQIARNLVTEPRLVFMDEPTGGLDVSVQARLLDLLRGLVSDLGPCGGGRHARSRRRAAAVGPDDRDEGRPGDRGGSDRPGARRSARALHPASRFLHPAGLSR
jgi:putative phosphonate transport system ATP-binding protein